jgi:hypothetical protein
MKDTQFNLCFELILEVGLIAKSGSYGGNPKNGRYTICLDPMARTRKMEATQFNLCFELIQDAGLILPSRYCICSTPVKIHPRVRKQPVKCFFFFLVRRKKKRGGAMNVVKRKFSVV